MPASSSLEHWFDYIGGRVALVHQRKRFVVARFDTYTDTVDPTDRSSRNSATLLPDMSVIREKQPIEMHRGI